MKLIKQFFMYCCLCFLIGCANSSKQVVIISDTFNLENTINNGGTYIQVKDDRLTELIDNISETSKSLLNLKNTHIALLDIFENKSNYVWYATDTKQSIYYRFISNKQIDSIQYAKRKPAEIKLDLKILNKK